MPAYVIVDVDVHNPDLYEDYKQLTPASVSAYGGKFIVRGGQAENLEGDWQPKRIVVLEFPSMDVARQWWGSAEYAPAKALRQQYATTRMILVEGLNYI